MLYTMLYIVLKIISISISTMSVCKSQHKEAIIDNGQHLNIVISVSIHVSLCFSFYSIVELFPGRNCPAGHYTFLLF